MTFLHMGEEVKPAESRTEVSSQGMGMPFSESKGHSCAGESSVALTLFEVDGPGKSSILISSIQ